MACRAVYLFFCSVKLYLEPVDAAIDLDEQRLQIDRLALELYEVFACGIDGRNGRIDAGRKLCNLRGKDRQFAFEREQRLIRTFFLRSSADQHTAADENIACEADRHRARKRCGSGQIIHHDRRHLVRER